LISSAYLKNHALLTDAKILISVPFLEIKLNDDLFNFFEIITSFNILTKDSKPKKNPKKVKEKKNANENMKEDAILMEELNFLLKDHHKDMSEKKNCKHCIIKFKKVTKTSNSISIIKNTFNFDLNAKMKQ
jgi:hypothetical protein